MESQNNKNSYTCVLLFKEGANKTNTQLLTFSYAQFLKKLGVCINIAFVDSINITYFINEHARYFIFC